MIRQHIHSVLFAAIAAMLVATSAHAAPISFTGGVYTQDFDSLDSLSNNATWTNGSTLAGWSAFTGNPDPDTAYDEIERNEDSGNAEGLHNLGTTQSATERALGFRQFGESAMIVVEFVNDTGGDLTEATVDYVGELYRIDSSDNTNIDLEFQYSLDATSPGVLTGTWTDVDSLDFEIPTTNQPGSGNAFLDGNDADNQDVNSATFTLSSPWAAGDSLYLRWWQPDGPGISAPGLDDFEFTAVPEPASLALLGLGGLGVLVRRRA